GARLVNSPSRRATIGQDATARLVLLRTRPPCAARLRRQCGGGLWHGLSLAALDLRARHAACRARAVRARASDRNLVLVLPSRQAAAGCRARNWRGGSPPPALSTAPRTPPPSRPPLSSPPPCPPHAERPS